MFGEKGFFGDLFDWDHDGKLDSVERMMDFMLFEEMTRIPDEPSWDDEDEFDEDYDDEY